MKTQSQSMVPTKIMSVECWRIITLIAIITIHAKPFSTAPLFNGEPWLSLVLNQAGRFAVPLFFLLAGYFIAPKLLNSPFNTLKRYSLPLLKVWFAWSLICLLAPFNLTVFFEQGYLAERHGYWQFLLNNPLNTLFEGGLVHLWYIPALVCAISIIALLIRYNKSNLLLPLAIALYIYGLMAGSYQPIFDLEAPIFTRNGPFFSCLLVVMGFEIRRNNWHCQYRYAVTLALLGMLLHFFEATYLLRFDAPFNTHDFLVGTPFWSLGLFMALLAKPHFGESRPRIRTAILDASKDVLGVYVVHLLVVIYVFNIARLIGVEGLWLDISIIPLVLLISIGITRLINKTPLQRVLLR